MIDTDNMQKEVEKIISSVNQKFEIKESGDNTKTYILKKRDAKFEMTVGPNWIGYSLHVPKDVLGKDIGFGHDTDNYPPDEKNKDLYLSVFSDLSTYLRFFLDNRIYIGKIGKKVALIIPSSDGGYRQLAGGRFVMKWSNISVDEFNNLKTSLHLIE